MCTRKALGKGLTILYFAAIFLPFMGFLRGSFSLSEVMLNARRLRLLGNSVLLALLSAGGCVFTGLLAASFIHNSRFRRSPGRWFFLLFAPIPYYMYALTWMYLVRMLGQFDRRLMSSALTGLLPCVFVNIFSFLPAATGLILVAMEAMDKRTQEMGMVYARGNRVFLHIVLPGIFPALAAAGCLVFVLSITDFSVPSLFQYQTYTLEIFSEYSAGGSLKEIGVLSLPLVVLALILVIALLRGLSSVSLRKGRVREEKLVLTGILKGAGIAAFLTCILQLVIPVMMLLIQIRDWGKLLDSLLLCADELFASLLMAAVAAVCAVLLAGPAGAYAAQRGGVCIAAVMFPVAVPSSLIAMGLLSAVNGSIMHWFSQTLCFPALGCAIKYMPFAALLFVAQSKRIPKEELLLGRVYAENDWQYLWRILLPAYRPAVLGAFALVFALALSEEGITLILMPPGYEMLAVKIYTYLHYGASELVSGFCLITVTVTSVLFLGLFRVLHRKRRGDSATAGEN